MSAILVPLLFPFRRTVCQHGPNLQKVFRNPFPGAVAKAQDTGDAIGMRQMTSLSRACPSAACSFVFSRSIASRHNSPTQGSATNSRSNWATIAG